MMFIVFATIIRILKPSIVGGRHRRRDYIDEVDETYASHLRERSKAQTFDDYDDADRAVLADEILEWAEAQSLAARIHDERDDDFDIVGADKPRLYEYIARHATDEDIRKQAAGDTQADTTDDTADEDDTSAEGSG